MDEIAIIMRTLFLKSNILHIRTNEGVFEVSNPEGALSLLSLGSKKDLYDGKNIEWPHGVERVSDCSCQVNKTRCWGPCGADTTVKIRLIPEEKKAESAYKEVESLEPQEKLKKGDAGFKWFTCPTCDGRGSVPQDSAPSESQEELLAEILGNWQDFISDPDNNSDFSSAKQQFMKAELEKFTIIETDKELSYDKIRSEYLKHRGRIWTKEEVMLKWIIENYKLITRKPE